ncbi:hypothetical protein Tco_1278759, partial [Tanacetum coccineum]
MSNTNNTMQTQTSSALHNDTVSLCSVSKDQEIQRLQEKAQLSKGSSMNDAMNGGMDFIEKYMLETILHQQEIQKFLSEKKLMQTQEVHSNTVQELKDDSVVIENTCFGKENSNSEPAFNKLVNESSLVTETKDVHAIKYKMSKAKERCIAYFRSLHSYLQVISNEDLKGTRIEHGFKRSFMSLFGQDDNTFISMIQMTDKYFVEYTKIKVKHFRDTLLQLMGNVEKFVAKRTRHQRQYDRRVNKRQMQMRESKVDSGKTLDVDLVVIESSGTESEKQNTSMM